MKGLSMRDVDLCVCVCVRESACVFVGEGCIIHTGMLVCKRKNSHMAFCCMAE